MRGLSGDRLLRRFLGRNWQLTEGIRTLGVGSTDQADGDTTRISVDGCNRTEMDNEMSGYRINPEQASSENTYFRNVLFTGVKVS